MGPTGADLWTVRDVPCYVPERAMSSPEYPPGAADRLCVQEETNFWFLSRNRIISYLLRRFAGVDDGRERSLLEIGCGTGFVLRGLAGFPGLKLSGGDIFLGALRIARERLPGVRLAQFDAAEIPFDEKFDIICAFDMLEHVPDDAAVLRSVGKALKPGGTLFVTVPQHPFLWSVTDVEDCHFRRYRRVDLVDKLQNNGFQVLYRTSFVSALLPVLAARRAFAGPRQAELMLPPLLNSLCAAAMAIDEWLIRRGWLLPWGASLAVVARRLT